MHDISLNGHSFKPKNASLQMFMDTGCSVIFGHSSFMDPIVKMFPSTLDCENVSKYPDLVFNIEGDAYPVSPADYILRLSPTECVLGLQSVDNSAFENMFNNRDSFR